MWAAASGRLPAIQLEISQLVDSERLLSPAAVVQTTRKTVLRRTGVGHKRPFGTKEKPRHDGRGFLF